MSAQRSILSTAGERGIALMTTILMMVLMSALLVGFTSAVMSDQSYRAIDRDRARAFYGAQSGIEKLNADLARLFINQVGPSDATVIGLGAPANRPTIPNVTFVDVGTSPAYSVTPMGAASSGIISSGAYEGLMALKRQFQLDATARAVDGGEVHLKRVVEAVAIPVFQFGIFSDVDLAFNAADAFDFGGRVHTNKNLYLAEGSGNTLVLRDKVTAVGQIVRQVLSNGVTISAAGQTGTVNMTQANTTGPFRALAATEGSVVAGPTSALTTGPPSWSTISLSTYVGKIRNGLTGVTPLNLDLVAANGANIDLIRRPPSTETLSSAIFAERYFKKVSVRILLSDTALDITSLPSVSAGAPVALDGDWSTAPPAGYVLGANKPAVARSDGRYADSPSGSINSSVNAAVAVNTTNSATIPINPTMPDYFKLPTLSMTVSGTNYTVTCTGKTPNTFTGCTRSPNTGTVSVPVNTAISGVTRTVDARTVSTTLAAVTWNSGATVTLTTTGAATVFPTMPFSVNTFFIRDKHIQVTCTGYSTAPAFTGCNVPVALATGDKIETGYLSNAGTGTIGGFLKVEIQTSDNVWQDVTAEWLSYGIAGPNLGGRPCMAAASTAIIRFQRYRDNNEPSTLASCTYAGSTASTDYWPNVLFDVREALSRDAAPTGHNNRVMLGGLMHYVELDAKNLSAWFARTGSYAAGTGNLAMREGGSATGGYSVYFSDRRSNRNSSNQETGEYGWEDIINPSSATGAPDGALNTGEDVNANGVLDVYGQFPSYNGAYNTVPPGAIAPLDSTARPLSLISGGQARVNRSVLFRRALKVMNGSIGNLIAPGLTIAAENPVYLQGDWNASTGAGWTGASVATSIAADTVVALSNNWSDINSFGNPTVMNPYDITGRRRSSTTYYRVALISGKGTIFPAGTVGGTFGTDGGAHNFIRYIEGDALATDLVYYMGSMVNFYYTRQNLMPHKCCNNIIYGVPNRNYTFDINFLDPTKLPPLTPAFRDINALGFSQETRPGK
ncbi:MAG: pilus assembly PilX N-terminal domain-containing protein [Vicinamibacterales bacterium]